MADILEQQMQRNDGALLIKTIRYALNTIQELISLQLTPDSLMGVILHMSCMVDRLQKGKVSSLILTKRNDDKMSTGCI